MPFTGLGSRGGGSQPQRANDTGKKKRGEGGLLLLLYFVFCPCPWRKGKRKGGPYVFRRSRGNSSGGKGRGGIGGRRNRVTIEASYHLLDTVTHQLLLIKGKKGRKGWESRYAGRGRKRKRKGGGGRELNLTLLDHSVSYLSSLQEKKRRVKRGVRKGEYQPTYGKRGGEERKEKETL